MNYKLYIDGHIDTGGGLSMYVDDSTRAIVMILFLISTIKSMRTLGWVTNRVTN